MDNKSNRASPLARLLLGIALALAAGHASAAEYWLCAKAGMVTMPDASVVAIWGYVHDDNNDLSDGCAGTPMTLPGPALTVAPTDTAGLTVHLRNELPEPTSIVIPGQGMPQPSAGPVVPVSPVKFTDATGRQRVRSFTHEAAIANGLADYVWSNLKPGTYLYHSGTHPQVQVQMGLYGALTKNAGANEAYPGVLYDAEATLLLSEIDPAQHGAIAAGTFGTPAAPGTPCLETDGSQMPMTSTLCYRPKYFLINGKPFAAGDLPLATLVQGQNTLLRLLNAGSRSYVPLLQGMHMKMIAEDGNRYQYRDGTGVHARDQYQYSTWLAALKTTDVIVNPTAVGNYPIYDRRLNTVTSAAQDGGIFGVLAVAQGTQGDVSITKTDGVLEVVRGTTVQYTIVVDNPGPVPLNGATVSDPMPAAFSAFTWTCSATPGSLCLQTGGSGALSANVNVAAGGSATFVVNATVSAATTSTSVTNTATVTVPPGFTDTNTANNTASDTDTILASQADLGITKSRTPAVVFTGTPVTYTVVVNNAGPNAVIGATVVDTMPAALTGVTWTCAAASGSTCPAASGSGSINGAVALASVGSVTFTINGTVSGSGGTLLANTATVAAPVGTNDPNVANNSATDSTTIQAATANLAITKTDGIASVVAGANVTYTIAVSNAGPSAVIGAAVADTLPPALINATWTCVAIGAGSGCGTPLGAGSIATTVNLGVGGTATFTLNATVATGTTGSVSNTATVTAPVGVTDPNGANNTATDTDTIAASPTVSAYFSTTGNTALPGVAAPYDDADIYAWMSDGTYTRVFDASAAGVPAGANVDAFAVLGPNDIYLSLNNNGGVNLPGLAGVQDEDIVRWNGATWTMYFDGSDVGLSNGGNPEDVDAFALLPDGSLLVSTTGASAVPGVAGVASHDLLRCAPGSFGAATVCTPWSMYFDGSDIGLTTEAENVRYVKVLAGGEIHFGTSFAAANLFAVASGANSLSGTGDQVFRCTTPTTGAASACGGFSLVLTLPTLPAGSMDAIYLP